MTSAKDGAKDGQSPAVKPANKRGVARLAAVQALYQMDVAGTGVIDLAVASALVSSIAGIALPADCVYFGEVSLSGAVRPVAHAVQRLKEAEKLGFKQAVLPKGSNDVPKGRNAHLTETASLPDLVARIAASGPGKTKRDD